MFEPGQLGQLGKIGHCTGVLDCDIMAGVTVVRPQHKGRFVAVPLLIEPILLPGEDHIADCMQIPDAAQHRAWQRVELVKGQQLHVRLGRLPPSVRILHLEVVQKLAFHKQLSLRLQMSRHLEIAPFVRIKRGKIGHAVQVEQFDVIILLLKGRERRQVRQIKDAFEPQPIRVQRRKIGQGKQLYQLQIVKGFLLDRRPVDQARAVLHAKRRKLGQMLEAV